jgi:hypothetical protein
MSERDVLDVVEAVRKIVAHYRIPEGAGAEAEAAVAAA